MSFVKIDENKEKLIQGDQTKTCSHKMFNNINMLISLNYRTIIFCSKLYTIYTKLAKRWHLRNKICVDFCLPTNILRNISSLLWMSLSHWPHMISSSLFLSLWENHAKNEYKYMYVKRQQYPVNSGSPKEI